MAIHYTVMRLPTSGHFKLSPIKPKKPEMYLDPNLKCPKCNSKDINYYLYPGHGRCCKSCGHEWFIGPRFKILHKDCVVCGVTFETTDGWQKFCSEECESKVFVKDFKKD